MGLGEGRVEDYLHHRAIWIFAVQGSRAVAMGLGGLDNGHPMRNEVGVPIVHALGCCDDEPDVIQPLALA